MDAQEKRYKEQIEMENNSLQKNVLQFSSYLDDNLVQGGIHKRMQNKKFDNILVKDHN